MIVYLSGQNLIRLVAMHDGNRDKVKVSFRGAEGTPKTVITPAEDKFIVYDKSSYYGSYRFC